MKYSIKNIIVMASVAMVNAACVGLDTAPYDRETDLTFWGDNEHAALSALNTCYTQLYQAAQRLYTEDWQWFFLFCRSLCV